MSGSFNELIVCGDEQLALYGQNSESATLDLAIRYYCGAFDRDPAPDAAVDYALSCFGFQNVLMLRATQTDSDNALEDKWLEKALGFTPPHYLRLVILGIQATSYTQPLALDSRYQPCYGVDDIDLAVEAYAAMIDMLQQQSKEYFIACIGYAAVLRARFYRKGDIRDIHAAIKHSKVVTSRCAPGHHYYSTVLIFYANLLVDLSEHSVVIQEMDEAIELIRNAMAVGQADDPSRPELLSTLGYCLVSRFLRCGNITDVENAVENCHEAVSSPLSLGAVARAGNMDWLALALFARYQL